MAANKWRTEDWVAVYLGFFIIAATLAAFSWKFVDLKGAESSFRWTTDAQLASRAPDWGAALRAVANEAEGKGQKEIAAKANDLNASLQKGDRKAVEKAAGDLAKVGGRNTVPGSLDRKSADTPRPSQTPRCSPGRTSTRLSTSALSGSWWPPSGSP